MVNNEITAEVYGCVSDEMIDFLAKLFAPMVFEALEKEEGEKSEMPHSDLLR